MEKKRIWGNLLWVASVVLMGGLVFSACKGNKSKMVDEEEDEESELSEGPERPDVDEDDIVEVTTARQFLLALKSNSHIVINTSEELNLTDALDLLIDEGRLERYYVDGTPRQESGVFWEPEYDGNTIIIARRHDIFIEGKGREGAFFIVTPSYADVLRFERCHNIAISNVTMGHEVTGTCIGDVLVLNRCENVTVDNCHLYGCGVNGLSTERSSRIALHGTHLYGCSEYGVTLSGTDNVSFDKCQVYQNGCGVRTDEDCENISFSNCVFKGNRGELFNCYSRIMVMNSSIDHHYSDDRSNVKLLDCEVHMDRSRAEDY